MEIRMMEYDFHIALDNVTINNGIRVIELPQSAVLVVKSDSNFPNFLTSIIRIPRYTSHTTTYEEIEYEVPTCKITNYTKDDIIDKNLIFLAPYYIIKFKEQLDEINDNREQLNKLITEYHDIYSKISKLSEQNTLDESYLYDVISLTEKLIDVVASNKENIRREVNFMGGNVLKLDREILMEECEKRGKELGEERLCMLISEMIKSGTDNNELERVSTNKDYREEMYKAYNIQ